MKKSRELPTPDIKILWAHSFNRCMFNEDGVFCEFSAIESKEDGEQYTLTEQAHILPHSDKGPRSGVESNSVSDGHENRILLCPTHHKLIDEDPGRYTSEAILEMKRKHIEHYKGIINTYINNVILLKDTLKIELKSEKFADFVDYIINFISNKKRSKIEHEGLVDLLRKNSILMWHFLHNQKNDLLFPEIKKELIPSIIGLNDENINNQFKLLEYFEKNCFANYSDDIIDSLDQLKKTNYEQLKRKIAIMSKSLKPKSNFKKLYNILLYLISSNELIVKEFAIDSATSFLNNFSDDEVKALLEESFKPNQERNVVNYIGGGTKLIHQGKDLTDGIFRSAANLLGSLLKDPTRVSEFIGLAMDKIDNAFIREELIGKEGLPIKYNYLPWLSDNEHFSNREYETDPEKKLSYELLGSLLALKNDAKDKFLKIAHFIIDNGKNLIYFEILNRLFETDKEKMWHDDFVIIEQVIFNKDLWRILPIKDKRWNDLFQFYFSTEPTDVPKFEKEVMKYSIPDEEGLSARLRAELLSTIPQNLISKTAQKIINDYENKISEEHHFDYKIKVNEHDEAQIFSGSPWEVDRSWIKTKQTINKLIDRLNIYIKDPKKSSWEIEDLGRVYSGYFENYPDDLVPFYQTIGKKNIELKGYFSGYTSQVYIEHIKKTISDKNKFYQEIINLYYLFAQDINGNAAKINIARVLGENQYLRSEDIKALDKKLLERLKQLVIDLANDLDPKETAPAKTSFSVGLNSVRGIGTMLTCIFSYHYPKDPDLILQINKLSKDPNLDIQAYLIENLIYLIPESKNYPLCQKIVNRFLKKSNPIIDHAIIRYMFRLGNDKLNANLDFLEDIIIRNNDKEISTDIGSLVGQAFLHQVRITNIFDKLLQGQIGNDNILERIAFEFQKTLGIQLILEDMPQKHKLLMLEYYKKLLSHGGSVANRASFVFYDEKLPQSLLELLYKSGVIDKVIEIKQLDVYHNINQYLFNCLKDTKLVDIVLDIILEEISLAPAILGDSWFASSISRIIEYVYANYNGKDNPKAEKIFNEGLKYGTDKFYDIFNNYYK